LPLGAYLNLRLLVRSLRQMRQQAQISHRDNCPICQRPRPGHRMASRRRPDHADDPWMTLSLLPKARHANERTRSCLRDHGEVGHLANTPRR
jgi:hypothetical protein